MVERFTDGEQLPPAYPVVDGRPATPDGDRVPQPSPPPLPLSPRELWRARIVAVLAAAVVVAAIVLGEVLR
ncbi:hypothetical protein ACGFIG_09175 [Micromonospora sp. NPDC049048]|uniref:hypothetical protein n=1 Tax=Micromonospora sp. NPDC049048 TaxID=3364263 RepID=UPI003711F242